MVVFEAELGSEISNRSYWCLYLDDFVHSETSHPAVAEQDISALVYVYFILQLLQ